MPCKVCRRCGLEKALDEFSRHAGFKDDHNSRCKTCKNEEARDFYEVNRGDILARGRKYNTPDKWRRRKYGIAQDVYDSMMIQQGGLCAIYGAPPENRALAVDHDHKTGMIRELLCGSCNMALGLMRDDPVRLQAAIEYLVRHGGMPERPNGPHC